MILVTRNALKRWHSRVNREGTPTDVLKAYQESAPVRTHKIIPLVGYLPRDGVTVTYHAGIGIVFVVEKLRFGDGVAIITVMTPSDKKTGKPKILTPIHLREPNRRKRKKEWQ